MKIKDKEVLNKAFSSIVMLIMILNMLLSCKFAASMSESSDEDTSSKSKITSLTLSKTTLSMKVGSMDYVAVHIKPSTEQRNANLHWSYDSSIISCDTSSNWGITINAIKEGQTSLRCSADGYDAICIITVSGFEQGYETTTEPYIYSNTSILQTTPGITEKVYVSLYGGDAGDIDGYTWTIDNTSVASIQPTGQYCLITANDSGYTRIKVTHPKAAYPYYIGVYVFEDVTKVTYITTSNNILTLNKDDESQRISVSLVNGKNTSLDTDFTWQLVNQDSTQAPINLYYNGNTADITPAATGSCILRITHPDAAYPLDILCRVITIVKNVYIEPDKTIVYLSSDKEETITSELKNINISEYSVDEYEYELENYNAAEICSSVGNKVVVRGKANGSTKLMISHPKAAYTREVLLIVTGQLTDAIDASTYITTTQNYIRTKVGATPTRIHISLKGGEDGDENDFEWTVNSTSEDGVSNVIELETPHGRAIHHNLSSAATATYAFGDSYITPKAEGTAVITITHPKIVYPTEILVKVLPANAILEEPLYFTGGGLIKLLNGENIDYTVELRGKNKTASDDYGISWHVNDSRIGINSNGNIANISAPSMGTGPTISKMTIKHNKAEAEKTVIIMTADDEETLDKMKCIYSDKLYYNICVDEEVSVFCNAAGFTSEDSEQEYDFSYFKWTIQDPAVISVNKNTDYPLLCTVKGLKSGTTKLTGSITSDGIEYSCEFTITVYPAGTIYTEPEIYFTTTQNVVTLKKAGATASVKVTAVNLPAKNHSKISWTSDNKNVATVLANGSNAIITAIADGETIINVSHPESQNSLKIYIRVGSEYVIPETEPIIYIAAQDVITVLKDGSSQKLQATLVNYKGTDTNGFSFEIDNESIATISAQSPNGIAYIKPLNSGQAEVTISHPKSEITKKVLIIVGNSAEELAGYCYLTTSSNVVAIGEGQNKSISVSIKNAENVVIDGYTWISSNPACVDITPSGATAMLKGNSIGTAIITVTNTICQYPLQIIVQCVDPIAASANPYIQLSSSVMTLTVGPSYTSISAELVGGTESDKSNFTWSSNDSHVAVVYGQNEVGKIRAMGAGTTYITISHPKASYPAQLLVVCDEATTKDCVISVPSSIINMKPTDSSQTITASLINGTTLDKYNFSWSQDVYDVVDLQYSANVCTITPKQTGSVTVTVSHPKAAYDQKIIVNVQQYTTFGFPDESMTITQGDVQFIAMQIPTTNVATHVEYTVENNNICTVTGTKKTAQLTAVGSGTTTVKARLIASSSGVEQAKTEMLVYVKEKETNAVYITATSTITTLNKGKSQTLSANLTGIGITTNDQYDLRWTTSDSDIVKVNGIENSGYITGQSIYITALTPGEAIITCSHPKAQSTLQFYVIVPGTAEKIISFNKSYMTILKGSSGLPLKATIQNAESSEDYYNLIWSCDTSAEGEEIIRIMGSGQNVTVYPVRTGQTTVIAQLPDSNSVAKCTVVVEAGKSFSFETNTKKVEPFHSKILKYTVSPADAILNWTSSQDDDYFEFRDLGCDNEGNGSVEISGIKEGSGILACVTDGGAKGTVSVRVSWDYEFTIKGSTAFTITPEEVRSIDFTVNPADADIHVNSTGIDTLFLYDIINNGNGSGTVVIKPIIESEQDVNIKISATNPSKYDEEFGSKTIAARFKYGKLTPVLTLGSSETAGRSYIDDNILHIEDGALIELNIGTKEKNAQMEIMDVTIKKVTNNTDEINCTATTVDNSVHKLQHTNDLIRQKYRINTGYSYYYAGRKIEPTDLYWDWLGDNRKGDFGLFARGISTSSYQGGGLRADDVMNKYNPVYFYCTYSSDQSTHSNGRFSLVRDTELDGKEYYVEEFESIGGFFCPGGWGISRGVWMQKAEKFTSQDTSIKRTEMTHQIWIKFYHNGKTETYSIPIYTDYYECPVTYTMP